MKCIHCGKAIYRTKPYRKDPRDGWIHAGTHRIYCVARFKAAPDAPIDQTEAWDLPDKDGEL